MTDPHSPHDADPTPSAAAEACLDRTRSTVLNVLIGVGCGIALTGLVLRGREPRAGIDPAATETLGRVLIGALLALLAASRLALRLVAGPSALRDPDRKFDRFYRGHVASAAIGALAVPLGLAYGALVRPGLDGVAPFWVGALALGGLAFPRRYELIDLDDDGHGQRLDPDADPDHDANPRDDRERPR